MAGLTPGKPAAGGKGRIIMTGAAGGGAGSSVGGEPPVNPPQFLGLVGYGSADFSDSCVITSLIDVPRCSPTVGRTIIVFWMSAGAVHQPFVSLTDNAVQETYFHCISAKNLYTLLGRKTPRASVGRSLQTARPTPQRC